MSFFNKILKSFLGDKNQRDLKEVGKIVAKIKKVEPAIKELSDDELRGKSREFKEKIKTKLENTLGLFLSIDGFSEEGVNAFQSSDKVMILMDGSDLLAILEERISFTELVSRKKQIASREGKIYVPFSQIR